MISIALSSQDWDRVVFALSHFAHNEEFQQALSNVLEALADDAPQLDD